MANNNYSNQNQPLDQIYPSPHPGMANNRPNMRPQLPNGMQNQMQLNPALMHYYNNQNLAMFSRGNMGRPMALNPQQMAINQQMGLNQQQMAMNPQQMGFTPQQMAMMGIGRNFSPQVANGMQAVLNGQNMQNMQNQQVMANVAMMQHPAMLTQSQHMSQARPNPAAQPIPQQTPKSQVPPTNQQPHPTEKQPTRTKPTPAQVQTPVPAQLPQQTPVAIQEVIPPTNAIVTIQDNVQLEPGVESQEVAFNELDIIFKKSLESFSKGNENMNTISYWKKFTEEYFCETSFISQEFRNDKIESNGYKFIADYAVIPSMLRAYYAVGATRIKFYLSTPKFEKFEGTNQIVYDSSEMMIVYNNFNTISKINFTVVIGLNKKMLGWKIVTKECIEYIPRNLLYQAISASQNVNGTSGTLKTNFTSSDLDSKFPSYVNESLIDRRLYEKFDILHSTNSIIVPIAYQISKSAPLKTCIQQIMSVHSKFYNNGAGMVTPASHLVKAKPQAKNNRKRPSESPVIQNQFPHNYTGQAPHAGTMMFNPQAVPPQQIINGQFVNPNGNLSNDLETPVTKKTRGGSNGTRGSRRGRGQAGAKSRKQSTAKTPKTEGGN